MTITSLLPPYHRSVTLHDQRRVLRMRPEADRQVDIGPGQFQLVKKQDTFQGNLPASFRAATTAS